MESRFKMLAFSLLFLAAFTVAKAQPGGGGRGMDPTQRAEQQTVMMSDSLSLSEKQTAKVKDINLKYANKMKEARSANADGDWEKMRASMDAIRTEQDAELKTVLTQEQFDNWARIRENEFKKRGPHGGGPGGKKEKPEDKKSE
ncbi:MAG: DUF4890 domain-containing protein [Bacteroidetes bacterium]|nr:DUF4890 domain-containing protein [Bacteroidota bacterium]